MDFATIVLIVCAVIVAVAVVAVIVVVHAHGGRFTVDIGGQTPRAAGGNDTSPETGFKTRLRGLGVFSGGIVAVLAARVWSMQLMSNDEYTSQAERNRTRTITTAAPRGRILDRNGEELVTNRPSLTVVAQADVADNEREVQLLGNLLGMPRMAVKRKIQDTTEGAQGARTVAVDVSRRVVAYLEEHPDLFPGVVVEQRTQRHYPHGKLAAHVLGYTGTVTADQLEASKDADDGITYESGDITGQAGVEYQYESVLQGVRGEQQVFVDADGDVTGYSTSVPAEPGSDVVLTIDAQIQKAAEDGLQHAISKAKALNNKATAGCVVVLDCTNGEILAMASYPEFDPSIFVGGISNADWEALSSEGSGYPLMDRAVSGTYASASTIKPLSAFAALNNGISDASSSYDCTGFWTGFGSAYGQYCWDHDGHGIINLRNGIAYSCDTVFYEIGKAFFESNNKEGLQDTYSRWGLGKKTGVDLPGEAEGRVPTAEWKWNYFSSYPDEDRTWRGGDTTNLAIGQGDILVTPLQMACIYMAIANDGVMWRPHVLKSVASKEGSGTVADYKPEKVNEVQEKDEYMALIHDALQGVIYEEDPAVTSHFTNLPVKVAGKTGTGEKAGKDPTAWFCAYAPADDPKYVVCAMLEEGGFGATSAMYAVRDTFGGIYGTPDDSTADSSSSAR
ncbi:penicillin-binding protein 2 [Atopobiaceae bacterium 24-176]